MTSFLSELGSKLADRWLSLLVLPGLLFVTTIGAAVLLGQGRAVDRVPVEEKVSAVAASSAAHSTGTVVLIAAGVLAACAAAGLAGSLAGRCVELAWTMPGRRWPARLLTHWRRSRWDRAQKRELSSIREAARAAFPPKGPGPSGAQHQRPAQPPPRARRPRAKEVGAAIAARERIGLVAPDRPTWIGDRLRAADQRVYQAYELDLASAWPALWLIVPDAVRTELGTAQDSYSTAARLTGWGVLYGIVGVWWWPALLIGATTAGSGWLRGRRAAAVLAQLVEATVDLYGQGLAEQLGVTGQFSPGKDSLNHMTGAAITARLRKDPHVAEASGQPDGDQGAVNKGKSE